MSQSFVVTNKGLALLAKMAAGEVLKIASVRTGAGTVDSALLKEQTVVTTQRQEVTVQNISYTSDSECSLILSLSNAGLETGYTLKQIGIFATDPDEGEILYCIYQDDSGVNHNIPSEAIVPGYNAEWECYLKFNQATTVEVSVDPANTISREVMETYVNDKTSESINSIPPKLIKSKLDEADIITTAGTGAAYTATVPGITELKAGVSFMMIPHTQSTTTQPTLNVNGMGAKPIRQPLTSNTGATTTAALDTWLTAGKPVRVRYDGALWEIDIPRPSATSLYGTVPVTSGGTGADTPAAALLNLGAQKAPAHANGWSIANICALEGIFYIDEEDDGNPDGTTIIGIADGYSAIALAASGKTYWANAESTEWTLESGNSGYELLWENASPSSEFPAQTIYVSGISEYRVIMIRTTENVCFITNNGWDNTLTSNWSYSSSNFWSASRLAKVQTDNLLVFTDCYGAYGQSDTINKDNRQLKPLEIYGVKGVSL